MKGTWVMTSLFSGLFFLVGLVPVTVSNADAVEVKRVKCRIDDDSARVQIGVDVRDVDIPTIDVTVENYSSGGTKTISGQAPDVEGDVQVEWESDPDDLLDVNDEPEGTRAPIDADFADAGDLVKATATGDSTGKTVTCVAK